MATAWQTLEEAAMTLGISSRTLHRRLAKGDFQTRLENNRREVLITIAEPEIPEPSQEISPTAAGEGYVADVSALADDPTTADRSDLSDMSAEGQTAADVSADVQTTLLALHEDRIRRTDLAIMAYQQSVNVTAADARRAHLASRLAWGATATVTTALFLAVTWGTHRVTQAQGEAEHLSSVVRQLSDTADAKTRLADALRQESEAAHVAAARMEGQLAATKIELVRVSQSAHPAGFVRQPVSGGADATAPGDAAAPLGPTTQPVSLRERLRQFLATP